jgi:O-antigen biosynthesis protein
MEPRLAAEHRAGRRRALFVDLGLAPSGLVDGGYAAVQDMRLLQSLGYKVTFVPERLMPPGPGTEYLQRMGVEVAYAPYTHGVSQLLRQRGSEFHLVYLADVDVARRALGHVRRWAPGARIVLQLRDRDPLGASPHDSRVLHEVDAVLSYRVSVGATRHDERLPPLRAALAPYVVDVPGSVPPPAAREGVAFIGTYRDPSDREAVEFLCREVMPPVRGRRPGIRLHVYGPDWEADGIRRYGVHDVAFDGQASWADAHARHRIALLPFTPDHDFTGRIVHALACGVPQVLSRTALASTGLSDGLEVDVADTASEWADRIIRLCGDDEVWQARSDASRQRAREAYSFEQGRSLMYSALEMAGEQPTLAAYALVVHDARPIWSI